MPPTSNNSTISNLGMQQSTVTYQPFINSSSEWAVALSSIQYLYVFFSHVNCRKNVIRINSTQQSKFMLSIKCTPQYFVITYYTPDSDLKVMYRNLQGDHLNTMFFLMFFLNVGHIQELHELHCDFQNTIMCFVVACVPI